MAGKDKEHWTPEQLSTHNRRERTKFKLELHIKHLAREERRAHLEKEPEPWSRPREKPKPFTEDQVEKWNHRFYKKELKKRKKERERKKIVHDKNQIEIKKRIWDRKVENWFENKLLSLSGNKKRIVAKMEQLKREEEEATMKFVRDVTDEVLIKKFNDDLTAKNKKKVDEAKAVLDLFNKLKGMERMPKKRDVLQQLAKDKKLKQAAMQLSCTQPVIRHPEFINCFMVSPAKVTGFLDADEFSTFFKCVGNIGVDYVRAKEAIKEEDTAEERAEEEKAKRKVELRKQREQQKINREKAMADRLDFVANNVGGVYFKPEQRRVRNESGNV